MLFAKGNSNTIFRVLSPFIKTITPFLILPFILVEIRTPAPAVPTQETKPPETSRFYIRDLPSDGGFVDKRTLTYDKSVFETLRKMNLTMDHLALWISDHPDSALLHLRYMPTAMQRDVASTAIFIRICNRNVDEKTAWREAAALIHYSAKYGVPATLATAVAYTESHFNPGAVSPKGAAGVMQVMWRVHNGLLISNGITGRDSLEDPEKGVAAGCLLLARYIKAYGSVQAAMTRYYGASSARYQNKITKNMTKIATHHANMH